MQNYIDFKTEKNYEKLIAPANIIKSGGIVIFPTETVYGIGTNGLDEKAIKKLFEVKKRPLNKPISLLVSNMEMVESVARDITEVEYKLMEEFFPGPFTIILNKKDLVPNVLTSNTDTVGVRMPQGEIARKLVEYANVPIATPSANISGKESGTNLKNIIEDFKDNVDFFIDEGDSKIGISSTIVKVIDEIPVILRQGSITKKDIEDALKRKF